MNARATGIEVAFFWARINRPRSFLPTFEFPERFRLPRGSGVMREAENTLKTEDPQSYAASIVSEHSATWATAFHRCQLLFDAILDREFTHCCV
jgi:hypothetical protein